MTEIIWNRLSDTPMQLRVLSDEPAEGKAREVGPVLKRLEAQGVGAVALCINATRHFRTLHAVAADPVPALMHRRCFFCMAPMTAWSSPSTPSSCKSVWMIRTAG